ncbi:MAG: class I SAM-dependent methyltransferase [Acidimicrobiia bacterium]|nr:class I SAM-dependent methyltransferase [Acidimicrobiia bacterium]
MFARVARRYDAVNRILSLGRDGAWRRAAIAHLPPGRVLDLGAGTGAANREFGTRRVVALDPSAPMLDLNPQRRRVTGYGERLPFADGSFDAVFSAYVFRNVESVPETLAEIHRVLRRGGAAAVVDLSRPASAWKRALHRVGTALVLPLVGLLARSPREYWYLHRSLDRLPPPERLFGEGPLALERLWRMGPFGFVYGVVLRKQR